jgi:hypothetical protein
MNSPMQRKVAFGVLGLALTALVVDRAVLGPEGASAATPAVASAPAAVAAAPAAGARRTVIVGSASPRSSSALLDSRLKVATGAAKWSSEEVVASMRTSPSWAVDGPSAQGAEAESFRQKHELKAIMSPKGAGDAKRIALIGGRPYSAGEQIDGYTLVSVGTRSAVFESGATRVVLTLNGLADDGSQGR